MYIYKYWITNLANICFKASQTTSSRMRIEDVR